MNDTEHLRRRAIDALGALDLPDLAFPDYWPTWKSALADLVFLDMIAGSIVVEIESTKLADLSKERLAADIGRMACAYGVLHGRMTDRALVADAPVLAVQARDWARLLQAAAGALILTLVGCDPQRVKAHREFAAIYHTRH